MQSRPRALPELRPELRLLRGATSPTGAPTWIIHDLVQNRFIQIDSITYQILSAWTPGASIDDLIATLSKSVDFVLDPTDIEKLLQFIQRNKLALDDENGSWRRFDKEKTASRRSIVSWLIHNYLFFRVPLIKPQKFLETTLPFANWFASPSFTRIVIAAGLVGLYFSLQQWDVFASTIPELFTLEGVTLLAIALVGLKAAHELGHAYTAVRYGCRVPTMGVAFMVMIPLLYTDVTDSWRLTDRRQRFRIHIAGIRVEASIAAFALLAWAFLPDGSLKGLAFTLCAVSLATSLLINLNPLMRFDGYHLLSDLTGIDNLQDRSFELGTWRLREILFSLKEPCPEQLPARSIRFLIVYAWLTWIYRLVLFTGIALMVYHFFFKALGIVLFLVEIVFFILRPVWAELRVWWHMRARIIQTRRTLATAGLLAALALTLIVPWSARVSLPSIVEMAAVQPLFAPRNSVVSMVHVKPGSMVTQGDPIVTLTSPDIEQQLLLARTKLKLAKVRFARRGVVNIDREASLVLENQISALETQIMGLEIELAELVLRAPISGRILELNPAVHPHRWIGPKEMVALIGEPEHHFAKGYLSAADLGRIDEGAKGWFVPESTQRSAMPVRVSSISVGASRFMDVPEVAAQNNGVVASSADEQSRLIPNAAQYLVQMSVDQVDAQGPELSIRGTALIEGRAESILGRTWRHVLSVLVREAGA